tara:strand:+ start:2541 stop:3368 length:828 start_codon:yes stop_codon:yes gene_type:complete
MKRSGFIFFIGLAVALMIISQVEPVFLEKSRTNVTDLATPVLGFFSRPAASVSDVADSIDSVILVREENARLRKENERLLQNRLLFSRLKKENEYLREMLNTAPDPDSDYVTARVVGDAGGPFVRTLLVAAGNSQGVEKGQAVVASYGLVGRVVEAGRSSARVLLITDLNSRIPIVLEASRLKGILAGNNTDNLVIDFLKIDSSLSIGDQVVTSGEGGAFPPGIPIGYVKEIREEMVIVEPWVKLDKLEFVTVLDYAIPGILPSTSRAGRAYMID